MPVKLRLYAAPATFVSLAVITGLAVVRVMAFGGGRALARMGRRDLFLMGLLVLAFALFRSAPAVATMLPAGFGETTLTSGLNAPTAVDWAPDGRMFIAEKRGVVRVQTPGGDPLTLLDIRDEVNNVSDRGLLGLAVDTNFQTNGYLYLLYTYELNPLSPDSTGPMVSRLTRVKVKPDNTLENPGDPETVILGTEFDEPCPNPDDTVDCIPADFYWHVIGTVRSDPTDGTLWVGSGDSHPFAVDGTSYRPLDERTYAGKILHVDRNGRGLPNHPFCPNEVDLTDVCTKIYAKGFRNPFRFTLRPGKGPVVGDVGNGHEELDLIRPGGNYGWPCYEGHDRVWLYDQEARCEQEYAKEGTPEAALPPAWTYPRPQDGSAIIAGPTYPGGNYPSNYKGKIFVGDYVQGWVKRLSVNSSDEVTGVENFATNWPSGVDLELMPNGDLAYVSIGLQSQASGVVSRLTYADGNLPPTPVASATPQEGPAPLTVQFKGSDSSDPEGDPLTYDWNFGDGSPHGSEPDPVHTYTDAGSYTARLTVDDGYGRYPNTTVSIQVGDNAPPTAQITTPLDGATYRDGEVVELAGAATDPEDGPLTGDSLSWHVLLHHRTHLHEVGTFTGERAQFTAYDDHDADSHYEIALTATDSGGRSAEQRIEIRPETVKLLLASSPPGAPITYPDKGTLLAPVELTAAVAFKPTIEAAETFPYRGRTYRFDHWSDGGARQHQVTIPETDATLTATYQASFTDQVHCGDTITTDTTLHKDLVNCPHDGIVIGADGITLDLNGHLIDGDDVSSPECECAVVNEGHDRVTVRHGSVRGFDGGVSMRGNHNRLLGISALGNHFFGLGLFHSAGGLVRNSSGSGSVTPEGGTGIYLIASHNARILDNSFKRNGDRGIGVIDSNHNLIKRNLVSRNHLGILLNRSDRNRVRRNRSVRDGEIGIYVAPGGRNAITRNRVTHPEGVGIEVDGGNQNVIARNSVRATGDDAISLGFAPVVGSVVRRNHLRGAGEDGVHVHHKAKHTHLRRNHVFGAKDDGLDVNKSKTKVTRNEARRNGDLGIEAVRGVIDGGGNRARGNGDPRQCTHIVCN